MLNGFVSNIQRSLFPHGLLNRGRLYAIFTRSHGENVYACRNIQDEFHLVDALLLRATSLHHVEQAHAHVLIKGRSGFAFLVSRFITAYSRFGEISISRRVFESSISDCSSNILFWNSIIRVHVRNECYGDALELFVRMREFRIFGDKFTYPLVLRACAMAENCSVCKVIHGNVLEMGFSSHLHIANELMIMYAKVGCVGDARNVFDRMPVRNHISWNVLLSKYAMMHDCDGALEIFRKMQYDGIEPTDVSWVCLLSCHSRAGKYELALMLYSVMRRKGVIVNAESLAVVLSVCTEMGAETLGKSLHCYVVKVGCQRYVFVSNALIGFHGKCGDVRTAHKLFQESEIKNIVTWNTMITSYCDAGFCAEALEIFSQLQNLGSYSKLRPDAVSWTAVISGFASIGRRETALNLFRQMQVYQEMNSVVTMTIVLSVCAELSVCKLGREIHGHSIKALVDGSNLVANGLINMYFKCGSLREGRLVFKKLKLKDMFSWNILISGYGAHGMGKEAVEVFEEMNESGLEPDGVTFIALLSACNHSGLLSEGRRYFDLMCNKYRIEPMMEHYGCMVDLLGRGGLLQEAADIVKNMPFKPNSCVLGSILTACVVHKNMSAALEISSYMGRSNLEPGDNGHHMLLSKMHAACGMWEESVLPRVHSRINGLRKIPGQSWIEVNH